MKQAAKGGIGDCMQRLKLLWQALTLDKRGVDEALEMLADIREFYVSRNNFNPEPIQPPKEIPIRFEEQYHEHHQ